MAQHDLIIDNAGGATVRADINNALAALGSSMKGPNAPSAPLAGMLWVEDDNPSATVWTVKMYDGADWISLGTLDSTNNRFTATSSVAKSGDTMTGALVLPASDPSGSNDATRKAYVDTKAPLPTSVSGLGSWLSVTTNSSGNYTLPAGGTWAYFWSAQLGLVGLAAGGTQIVSGDTPSTTKGFAWRIA